MSAGAGGAVDGAGNSGAVEHEAGEGGDGRFRATLVRVLLVQIVALALLGLLQAVYHG